MPKKILLADDSLTIQKVVELTFSDSDYELVCVSNGERALEKVREDRPDLILADVVMPEKNGYEVCEAIKGDPATSRIPVVLLSGTFEPFDRPRAERIGADAIVSKPFDSQQLLAQVDALIAKAPPSPAPQAAPSPIPQTTAAIAIPNLPPPPPLTASAVHHDDPPFDVGFSAEDFTAAVRLPPARTGIDPFEEEYVRGDVDSAIEAFEKAHPRFGFGSELDAEPSLASQPLDRSEPAAPSAPKRDLAPRSEEPARRDDAPREPQWLREEPEKSPFGGLPEESPAVDFSTESSSIADEAATVAIQRSQIPTVPTVPADQLPTVEMPRPAFERDRFDRDRFHRDRDAEEDRDRRSPLETADTSSDAAMPSESPSPFETAAPASIAGGPREISEQDASDLFDVEPRRMIPEIDEPHPMPAPEPVEEPEPPSDADRKTEETGPAIHAVESEAPDAPTAAAGGSGVEEPHAVPGDIEMLAQRSSIPELTRMLSSMRSTGDITDEQLDRLAAKVVEKLSDKVVREIAWEVIPDMAEIVIRQRIKELEAGVE